MKNKAATKNSINGNQQSNKQTPSFSRKKYNDPVVSESSEESDEEVIENEEIEMESSNNSNESSEGEVEESGSEEEVEESGSEEEVKESGSEEEVEENGHIKNGTILIDNENLAKLKTGQIKSSLYKYIKNPEEKYKHDDRTIRLHNLPAIVKARHLLPVFSKYGKIEEIAANISSQAPGKYYALILFESKKAAEKSLEAGRMFYQGRHILIILLNTFNSKGTVRENNSVCVPLLKGIKPLPIVTAMESFGVVKHYNSHLTPTKKYLFIDYENPDSVELALTAKEVTVENRKLEIKKVFSDTDKSIRDQKRLNSILQDEEQQKQLAKGLKTTKKKERKVKTGFVQKGK